jgi:hypothetical protein
VRKPRVRAVLLLLAHGAAPLPAGAAPTPDCATQAAALSDQQAELPRLDITSPADRPPYCITLETIMDFAGRVKAHVARCPQSSHASSVAEWDKLRDSYAKLFTQYRCRRTL